MIKRIERLQKENMVLQSKIEEITKKEMDDNKSLNANDATPTYQVQPQNNFNLVELIVLLTYKYHIKLRVVLIARE